MTNNECKAEKLIELIKQIQFETIQKTVEACANNAKLCVVGRKRIWAPTGSNFNTASVYVDVHAIDRQSILQLSEYLKREFNLDDKIIKLVKVLNED